MRFNAVIDTLFSDEAEEELLTVAEAKNFCRIDLVNDDAIIGDLIKAAREIVEEYCCVSLLARTITATLQNELGGISLPYGPVVSVASITDENGTVIDSDSYVLTGNNFKSIKTPFDGLITVVYDAGYSNLLKHYKDAMLNQVDYMYNNRGSQDTEVMSTKAKFILQRLRRVD